MNDPYNLDRFIRAQEPVYPQIVSELRSGRKQSHWMWFIFPQLKGLGQSPMALRYGIDSVEEAQAYLNHPILGSRLLECTKIVNAIEGRSVEQIFGYPDDLKFRSSITLFAQAAPDNERFAEALRKYFGNEPDALTLQRL